MKMFRMPMTVWAMFITALLQAFALPVLTSALIMQTLDRVAGTNFFQPVGWTVANAPPVVGGGGPILFQHLFWFYSHPAVYVMILPGMGMVSDIIATFSRKPLFGYKPMVFAIAGIAGLGFIVWGHHMFQSGMNPALGATFMLSTMMIALPSAIKVFNWLGTMWGGRLQYTSAMLNAIAFVAMFIIGGLSGIFMAATPVDMHIHDTYFIVGHLHYVLFGGSTFAIFAAIYYWFPKMFGRMMNERLGLIHFFLTFIFFNGTFFLMHIIGMHGHPRRIADPTIYPFLRGAGTQGMNVFMTYQRVPARADPDHLRVQLPLQPGGRAEGRRPTPGTPTPWSGPPTSPPPHYNFERIPTVYHPPYEYSVPGVEEDYLPADPAPPGVGRAARPGHGLRRISRPRLAGDRTSCRRCWTPRPDRWLGRHEDHRRLSPWHPRGRRLRGRVDAAAALRRGLGHDVPRRAWPCPTGRPRSRRTCSSTISGTPRSACGSSTSTGSTGRRSGWRRSSWRAACWRSSRGGG